MAQRIWSAIKRLDGEWDVIHYHGHLPMLGALVPANINFVHTLHDQGAECITKTRFRNGGPCTELNPVACAGCAVGRPNSIQTVVSAYTARQYRTLTAKAFTRHQAICVSGFIESGLRKALAEHKCLRTSVVHNFIDASSINAAISVELACIRDASPNSIPTVFMAGRVDSTKGFGSFLGSIPSDRLANMRVRIAGDGPDFINLRDRYSPLGVKFLGWQDRDVVVREALAADVCVVPSICEEACATTVLEGLFLGKPVFALNRGGTPELTRYERFPGQLNLFFDMTSLVQALISKYVGNLKPAEMATADLADVHYRLPEILRIYRNCASRVNAVAGQGKMA